MNTVGGLRCIEQFEPGHAAVAEQRAVPIAHAIEMEQRHARLPELCTVCQSAADLQDQAPGFSSHSPGFHRRAQAKRSNLRLLVLHTNRRAGIERTAVPPLAVLLQSRGDAVGRQ